MPLRTSEQYFQSLRDGRRIFYRGELVTDALEHPVIGLATRHAAIDYEMAEDPQYRDIAVVDGTSRYYVPPRTREDLLNRSRLIE
ncbi:MAG TPA: 4-hydroxyphenylacetate 3-hydroxylase N-terminal domain-containing protein, partial [Chloroflexota bacterium]|nr:4-hydroxyphenylacetate 3-hydroxylase N-terminal domain-containing protein [Chloroflexota bacterium]